MFSRSWFYSSLSSQRAETLLKESGIDGAFLARHSETKQGDFTISVHSGGVVTHIRVQNSEGLVDLYGGMAFATLADLIEYYMKHDGKLRERSGNIIRLVTPLNCADPTTERWYHGQMTALAAETILHERGKDGSFLVRASQRSPGDFTLSARIRERVSHILIRSINDGYDILGGQHFKDLDSLINTYRQHQLVEVSGDVLRLLHPLNTTRVQVRQFHMRVQQLLTSNEGAVDRMSYKGGFWDEFETLQSLEPMQQFKNVEANKYVNHTKNRFKNIFPYDFNRVILRHEPDNALPGWDYINASYIRCAIKDESAACLDDIAGPSKAGSTPSNINLNENQSVKPSKVFEPSVHTLGAAVNTTLPKLAGDPVGEVPLVYDKLYIATQACLEESISPYWSMIWQDNIRIIIMVMKQYERGKEKCSKYWPDDEKRAWTDKFKLIEQNKSSTQDYTLRWITASRRDNPHIKRTIYHFQFTAWPETSMLSDPVKLLNMLQDIHHRIPLIMAAENPPEKLVVCVHCVSGIGRTGIVIVVDMIMDQIRRGGLDIEIDVQETVKLVRDQRRAMVQNEAQYKFIYMAVLAFIDSLTHRLDKEEE